MVGINTRDVSGTIASGHWASGLIGLVRFGLIGGTTRESREGASREQ